MRVKTIYSEIKNYSRSYYMYMHIMKALSESVKERWKESNLTQEEFAEKSGVALRNYLKSDMREFLLTFR